MKRENSLYSWIYSPVSLSMDTISSLIQEFKQLRRSRPPRRWSHSLPSESDYFSYSPSDDLSYVGFSHAHKKTVHWGPVTQIPPLPSRRSHASRSRVSARRPVRSILKPPTSLDQEMFRYNMWRMVGMVNERLDFTYQCIGDMSHMGDQTLELIMKWEERSVRSQLTRKVLESVCQLDNLSLEATASHNHRSRRLRRRGKIRF